MSELATAVSALVSPEFEGWTIAKENSEVEPFDPLLLIQSFIESEIPLTEAILIFDSVAESLKSPRFHLNSKETLEGAKPRFSFELIRSAVIGELVKSLKDQAPLWLSNYDGMFGLSTTDDSEGNENESDDDELIDPRNAHRLAPIILEIVYEADQLKVVHRQDRDIFVANITKYLRFCGFHRIERGFLRDFVRALCLHSSKSVLSLGHISDDDFVKQLEGQEELLHSAQLLEGHSRKNLLKLVLANFCHSTLNWAGHISIPSLENNQTQLSLLLKDADRVANSLAKGVLFERVDRKLVCERILSLFDGSRLSARDIFVSLDHTIAAERKNLLGEMGSLLGKLISRVRAALLGEFDTANLEAVQQLSSETYLVELDAILDRRSIDCKRTSDYVEFRCDHSFHTILSLARSVKIVADETGQIDDIEGWIRQADRSTITMVIVPDEPEKAFIEELEIMIVKSQVALVIVPRARLERHLSQGLDVRDLVMNRIASQFPFIMSWESDPFANNLPELPANISERDRSRLGAFQKEFNEGRCTSACQNIGTFFETRLRSYCLFILDTINKRKVSGVRIPQQWHIGGCLSLLDSVRQDERARRVCAEHLLNSETLKLLDRIRKNRNFYTHNEVEVEQTLAERFLADVALAISLFRSAMGSVKRVVSFPESNLVVLVDVLDRSGEVVRMNKWTSVVEQRKAEFKFGHRDIRILGYSYPGSKKDMILASVQCPKCRELGFQIVSGKMSHCPNACARFTELPSDWIDVVKVANSQVKNILTNAKDEPMPETDTSSSSTPTGWLKPIAEGISQALGPFGAPLRVFLSKVDDDSLHRLEAKVDQVLAKESKNQLDTLLRSELQNAGVDQVVAAKLAYWARIQNASGKDYRIRPAFRPFSASNHSEGEVINELCHLYEGKPELLRHDLAEAGIPLGRVRFSGILDSDIRDVVTGLRGAHPSVVLEFCGTIFSKHAGSELLADTTGSLELFLGAVE